jgi:hypothetical protein
MSSVMRNGVAYHGISVVGRGVFTRENGSTYAGQHAGGYACGLGVLTLSSGYKVYAEYGPDGQYDGRHLVRCTDGNTGYRMYERGKKKEYADVFADGTCTCNGEECAPDDPRLLALIAQVSPVEVRSSDGSAGPFCPRRRWRPPWPPRCTRKPSLVVARHSSHTAKHAHTESLSDACTGFFAVLASREAPSCTH